MNYDFSTMLEREGKDAMAIDAVGTLDFAPKAPREGFSLIPMWVADMNFPTFPGIQEHIVARAEHPAFGYFSPREEYFDSIIRWRQIRNGMQDLTNEKIGYENGVLGGVISALNVVCSRGDSVLLHSPTYIGFTSSLELNGYHIVLSDLEPDDQGIPRMNFDDMERKIEENHIHALLFCSPHNPSGRVWEQGELEALSDVCARHNVTVISDEIWADIILPGYKHVPTQMATDYLRENTVALYAPTKTFNLAGLVGSYHIIYNKLLRERVIKESSLSRYNDMNVLSMHALIGAYTDEGMAWTDQMCAAIDANVDIACKRIESFQGVSTSRPQGTYMLFVDCLGWCRANNKLVGELQEACWDVGVAIQDGRMFHGPRHIRMNLALPASYVTEAFDRLENYVLN